MSTHFVPAKVNLFLHVGPMKPNGRHDLDSLVVFAQEVGDHLNVTSADTVSLDVTGPNANAAALGDTSDNLVMKAALQLADAAGETHGAALSLEKHLPIAAGIGGGSADAAAALRALTTHWRLKPELATALATSLGGDVPVALAGKTALMRGEGERIETVRLPSKLPALLVNPGVACPTGSVFAAFDKAGGGGGFEEIKWPDFSDGDEGRVELINWLSVQSNDLEAPAIALQPVIGDALEVLDAQSGALLSRMSGSGATCFALFETLEAAHKAQAAISAIHPQWWARATYLGDSP